MRRVSRSKTYRHAAGREAVGDRPRRRDASSTPSWEEAGIKATVTDEVSGLTTDRFLKEPPHGLGFYSLRAAVCRESTGCGAVW